MTDQPSDALVRAGRAATVPIVLAVVALLWEAGTVLFQVPEFLLPPPSKVGAAILGDPWYFARHAWSTLYETLIGFALAVVLGVTLGLAIACSKLVERTLFTLLVSLNSVPKVALAPLFIVWLGTGIEPKIAMVVLITIFVIVIDFVHGLTAIDPEMLDLGRALRGTRLKILFKLQLPNALPSLFVGMKVGISLALIGAIVGEFVAARGGLGYVIMVSQSSFDTATMFGAIVVLALLGTVLFFAVELAERLALPWHVSRRRAASGPMIWRRRQNG